MTQKRHRLNVIALTFIGLFLQIGSSQGANPVLNKRKVIGTSPADQQLSNYFRYHAEQLANRSLRDIKDLEAWKKKRGTYRKQLFEMLGLSPLPPKTDLKPKITNTTNSDGFIVENVTFQSRPGLHVTGNLYRPIKQEGKIPAILYVCGHGNVKKNGISYGSKAHYQHHGAWFARNGYVCLTIDTLQLGEIEGLHHGTYREGMWWWFSRGYTPAGVEAWNCIRALDYLQSRPEVDGEKLGVTGRSGGGAYSWWISAIDERIKASVPVAGITNLKNYVIDGAVEGHCDCMFMVNTYQWDYAQVAALVAPRPLLISNTDKDSIFPLDGVVDVYRKTMQIYELYGVPQNLGLQITEGPHKDTQELRIHAFHWFNHFLKGDDSLIEMAATKFHTPEELKVFKTLPADQKNTKIHESFVKQAKAPIPKDTQQWEQQTEKWKKLLRTKSFRAWPKKNDSTIKTKVETTTKDGLTLKTVTFDSQKYVPLKLFIIVPEKTPEKGIGQVRLNVLNQEEWEAFTQVLAPVFPDSFSQNSKSKISPNLYQKMQQQVIDQKTAVAYFAPRGIGLSSWNPDKRKQIQIKRRFYLLGQSLEGMQIWDVRRAIQELKGQPYLSKARLELKASGNAAALCLYASLFEEGVNELDLTGMPASHQNGPALLNVMRFLDVPQALAMAASRRPTKVSHANAEDWSYPIKVSQQLGWDEKQLQIKEK
ncbi:MAG: acetylxylan esterase [Planctomycetes bacterium]|nr:acetylxylan esterase [Planctomycetota bacterium]MCH9776125.1 acetylxylan esterase [Planctomycetota bacterium]MCH9792048.1 acetylxylan esterase [Planctomycetota bacterium]